MIKLKLKDDGSFIGHMTHNAPIPRQGDVLDIDGQILEVVQVYREYFKELDEHNQRDTWIPHVTIVWCERV